MSLGRGGNWKVVLACLILAFSLLVNTMVVVEHDHTPNDSHSCDICHFGHMPWVAPTLALRIAPTVIEEWHQRQETLERPQDPRLSTRSCRAPPA